MTEREGEASGIRYCRLCSGDYLADFAKAITAAAATTTAEMTPAAFREWIDDEARESNL